MLLMRRMYASGYGRSHGGRKGLSATDIDLILFLLLFVLPATLVSGINTNGTEILNGIRVYYKLPGLAAGAINQKRSFRDLAVGFRKQGDPTAMTENDKFHLGSNTKAMTATLVAMFIEEGRLSWNMTLPEALPTWKDRIAQGHRKTTLAMLTAHRSGITGNSVDWSFLPPNALYNDTLSPVEGRRIIAEKIFANTPDLPPGGDFHYSNYNYILAGLIIDELSGPWEEVIRSKLWQPLGMTECGFGTAPESSISSVENPWPHRTSPSGPIPITPDKYSDNFPAFGPAGTVHCSMSSYSKFLALHLDGFAGRDTAILRAASFEALHTPYLESGQNYTSGGWFYGGEDSRVNGSWYTHSGTNTLNFATAILAPRVGEAYMAFTNCGSADGVGIEGNATNLVMIDFFDRTLTLPERDQIQSPTSTGQDQSPSATSTPIATPARSDGQPTQSSLSSSGPKQKLASLIFTGILALGQFLI